MGCSCSKTKKSVPVQVRRTTSKPAGRTIYKTQNNKNTLRRVLERY